MSNATEIRGSIRRAEKDLAQLEKARSKYSGNGLKDVDGQIKLLKETIKIYRSML